MSPLIRSVGLRRGGAFTPPPAFTPADLPGLEAWWKADGITGLSDGDPVATWVDSSGNGHAMTQTTSGQQPTYQTNELNGLPVVRFDGGDILSCSDNLANSGVFTLFAVAKVGTTGQRSILDRDGNTTPRIFQFRRFGTNFEFIAFNSTGGTAYIEQEAWELSTWAVLTGVRRATEVQAYVNGASNGATAAGTVNMTGTHPTYMGGFKNNLTGVVTANFVGDVAEVLIYDAALNDTDREAVEAYLATKYDLTLA